MSLGLVLFDIKRTSVMAGDSAPYGSWRRLAYSHDQFSCCFPTPFLFERTPIGPVSDGGITLESLALLAVTPPF